MRKEKEKQKNYPGNIWVHNLALLPRTDSFYLLILFSQSRIGHIHTMKHNRPISAAFQITIPNRITIQPILNPRAIHRPNISIHNLPIVKSGTAVDTGN